MHYIDIPKREGKKTKKYRNKKLIHGQGIHAVSVGFQKKKEFWKKIP